MSFIANTRGAILETSAAENGLGDVVDENTTTTAGLDDFAVSILERTRSVQDPSTNTWRQIVYYRARLAATARAVERISAGDRLRDNATGTIYVIDTVKNERSIAGGRELLLTMTNNNG